MAAENKDLPFFPYPEFSLGSNGKFVPNEWTRFVDEKLMTQPNMEQGLALATYQNWLDWQYGFFALADRDNPLERSPQELEYRHGIVPLWTMSFKDKRIVPGVEVVDDKDRVSPPSPVVLWEGVIEKRETEGFLRMERELIKDRFGNDALIERIYECASQKDRGNLTQIAILTYGGSFHPQGTFFLRIESTDEEYYRQSFAQYILTTVTDLRTLVSLEIPLDTELSGNQDTYALEVHPK